MKPKRIGSSPARVLHGEGRRGRRFALLALLALVLLGLAACAQAKSPPTSGAEPDELGEQEFSDADLDGVDDVDDVDEQLETAELELDPLDDDQVLPECEAGVRRCNSATELAECSQQGQWSLSDCLAPRRCELDTCRMPEPICEPGSSACQSFDTLSLCSSDGLSELSSSCAPGRCIEETCSQGQGTGESCASASDCAGQHCHCTQACSPSLDSGYCSTRQCSQFGCAPNEACIRFAADEQLCVLGCATCLRQGFACRELPGVDGRWYPVCYATDRLAEVGASCQRDADCAGGLCLQQSASGRSIAGGYCSAPCSAHAQCPSGAACVSIEGLLSGAGFCALRCLAGSCPASRPETFYVYCFAAAPAEPAAAVSICFQN